MRKAFCLIMALFFLVLLPAQAAGEQSGSIRDDEVYALYDLSGQFLTSLAHRVYIEDEYISADNKLYQVVQLDDESFSAYALCLGDEPAWNQDAAQEVFSYTAQAEPKTGKKLICMYSTHSDESYVPSDGDYSLPENAGIYDVDEALKKALEEKGIEVVLDETSSLPHDSEAYSRSRRIAEDLLKKSPDALLDIHRDGIPDETEYETKVKGEDASKVRLLVGRSNPNADSNRAFAKQLKAVADKKYPGLIKDIFIGKGNYNQELYPQSILLEFGTHTLDKERAIESTTFMADVLDEVLFGGTASAEGAKSRQDNRASGIGILWIVLILGIAVLLYSLLSTGSLAGMWHKIRRDASEVTGGALGKTRKKH